MGGADGEGGAGVRGDQIGVAGGARQPQHEGLLVHAVDSVRLRAVAVTGRVLTALARLAAAGRRGHGRQAQEPILVQVLQDNIILILHTDTLILGKTKKNHYFCKNTKNRVKVKYIQGTNASYLSNHNIVSGADLEPHAMKAFFLTKTSVN